MIDTIIIPGQSIHFNLKSRVNDYCILSINLKDYRLFTQPESSIDITIEEDERVSFAGDHAEINTFLLDRPVHSDWKPRGKWHSRGKIDEVISGNNAITEEQVNQVKACENLPKWYKQFEIERLHYNGVGAILSSFVYRKKLLKDTLEIPQGFAIELIQSANLKIENEAFLGNTTYGRLLSSYILFKWDPKLELPIPSSPKQWSNEINGRINCMDTLFESKVIRDVCLTNYMLIVSEKMETFDSEVVNSIHDPALRSLLNQSLQRDQPDNMKGQPFAELKLIDMKGNKFDLKQLKGKITLINFWATWCKPCYNEFDSENELVEQFVDQPVQIINICIESDQSTWLKKSKKHDLKMTNLFADEQASEKINSTYKTVALPHSLILDKEGKIIEYDCPRATMGADQLIMKLLNEE